MTDLSDCAINCNLKHKQPPDGRLFAVEELLDGGEAGEEVDLVLHIEQVVLLAAAHVAIVTAAKIAGHCTCCIRYTF